MIKPEFYLKPKALFVTTQFSSPAHSGGTLVTNEHLKLVAQYFETDFLSKTDTAINGERLEYFRREFNLNKVYLVKHWIITREHKLKAVRTGLQSLISQIPFKVLKHYSPSLIKLLLRLDRQHHYDTLFIDQLPAFHPYIQKHFHGRIVLFSHNAEFETIRPQVGRGLKQRFMRLERKKLKTFEEQTYQSVDHVFYLSNKDRECFPGLKNATILPAFARIFQEQPSYKKQNNQKPLIIGAIASWTWSANVEGLLWFLDEVVQKIPERVEVHVAGRMDDKLTSRLSECEWVKVLGRLEDLSVFYQQCDVMVIPVFYGAGVKIKVLDAMAHHKPIITTSHCMQGLGNYTQGIKQADDAGGFKLHLQHFITEPDLLQKHAEIIAEQFRKLRALPLEEPFVRALQLS